MYFVRLGCKEPNEQLYLSDSKTRVIVVDAFMPTFTGFAIIAAQIPFYGWKRVFGCLAS